MSSILCHDKVDGPVAEAVHLGLVFVLVLVRRGREENVCLLPFLLPMMVVGTPSAEDHHYQSYPHETGAKGWPLLCLLVPLIKARLLGLIYNDDLLEDRRSKANYSHALLTTTARNDNNRQTKAPPTGQAPVCVYNVCCVKMRMEACRHIS